VGYNQQFAEELLGLMGTVGQVTTKKMFGALAFYQGPSIFACLMSDHKFYLRAQGELAEELRSLGEHVFDYQGKSGKSVAMPYWTAPQDCLEDPDVMVAWCKKAIANAATKPLSKKAKKR
jgi:DNA transformation protein and related proteins